MSTHLMSLQVHVRLSPYGDALIYGSKQGYGYEPGLYFKQLLFARHQASYYGTALEVQHTETADVVVLPAEQVIEFWAKPNLLQHIHWEWADEAAMLALLAPYLFTCMEQRKYHPSFTAYKQGKLQWQWDTDALSDLVKEDDQAQATLHALADDEALSAGLGAAFSAWVSQQYYNNEAEAADLRNEFPGLFERSPALIAGMNEQAWLVAVGWKADVAPFRPILQLLEPEAAGEAWNLRLNLQDKHDVSKLYPVVLSSNGTAVGSWPDNWTAHVTERSVSWLERLRAGLPLERLIEGQDVLGQGLSSDHAWQFLKQDSETLLKAGWQVLLPAWWEAASRKKPRLKAKVRSGSDEGEGRNRGPSLFGFDSLVDFDWRIAIGDEDLSENEFNELLAINERLVQFRGQWIPLDPAFLAQIRRAMDSIDPAQGLSFQDVLQLHLLENKEKEREQYKKKNNEQADELEETDEEENVDRIRIEVELNDYLMQLFSQISRKEEWPLADIPDGLQATLRSYQHEGFAWLAFLRQYGLGAILADDMGLGKTIQLITYMLHVKNSLADEGIQNAPALIICPTSVLGNWQKELQRFAPSLHVLMHYGSSRLTGEAFEEQIRQADVVLTSFTTASLDQELLQSIHWEALCLDEAQNIKNAQTKQSQAVRSFPARHRVALTGTPIENRLSELWSLYDFIAPGYLGSAGAFQRRFATPIEKERDEKQTVDLKKLVNPFLLRRKKKDPNIQLDLPEKNEMKTYINLTAEQGALYDQAVNQLMNQMSTLKNMQRKGAILSALTQLKQLCDHPVLVTGEPVPGADGFPVEASDYEAVTQRSAKLERLLAMVKELREEGEKCLIFTQYIGMGQMLKSVLEHELQEPVLYLNGSASKIARDKMVEQFQNGGARASSESGKASDVPNAGFDAEHSPGSEAGSNSGEISPGVFILSLKAGGVGLNLTAANHVFHFDRWWNPAVENQATDRAYRMGQTKDVQVHKFISLGTLEERIDEMLENKQQLSDNVISSTEGWITEMSNHELRELITLRRG